MRTNNTFGIQFITRANKAKTDKDNKLLLPVYARISVDCHRVEVSLKQYVDTNNWNNAKGSVKGKSPGIEYIPGASS